VRRGLGIGVVLLLLFAGTAMASDMMTGGGWFIDLYSENRITVGFNGQPLDEYSSEYPGMLQAKGQFQLIDHGTKDRIHCEFTLTPENGPDPNKPWISLFIGPATLNGEGGYIAGLEFHDNVDYGPMGAGDMVAVILFDAENIDPGNPVRSYVGFLGGGNARQHEPK